MKFTLFIVALPLIISCAIGPSRVDMQSLEDLTIAKIENNIREEKIACVLQDISTLKRTGTDDDKKQTEILFNKASLLINKLFTREIEEKNFLKAASLFLTAEQANIELSGDWNYNLLISSMLFNDDKKVSAALKSSIARNDLNLSLLTDMEIIKLMDLVRAGGDKSFIRKLLKESSSRSLDLGMNPENFNNDLRKIDFLKGTVTIWVNRGMRIESGIGIPDGVIGSGFFIDKNGYLLTNYHVIESEVDPEFEGFSRLYIRLWDEPDKKIPAKVVGWDKAFDIALLKVEIEPEIIFSFSEGKEYYPGTPIIAIGSPGGLENTITSGIISASGRKFLQMGSVIQVDVPINHGNSGGPLIDSDGELVGVVFAGIEQFEGINFAIPGEFLVPLIPSLYKGGRVSHPFLGLAVKEDDEGLRVIYKIPGGNGSRAGLKDNDIITNIMGNKIKKIEDVNKIFLKLEPDMAIQMDWISDGVKMSGIIALGSRPDFPLLEASQIDVKENLIPPVFGMTVNSISESIFGSEYIVTDVFPGTIADETGLSVNDPFSIKKWEVIDDQKLIIMQIRIKKRKAGFLESGVQLGAYLGTSNFI